MAILRVYQGELKSEIEFEKKSSPLLAELLFAHHIGPDHPCGGRGVCGKCTVRIRELPGTETGAKADETGNAFTKRDVLSCRYRPHGDLEVWLPAKEEHWSIEETGTVPPNVMDTGNAQADTNARTDTDSQDAAGDASYGIAVDIGTTTVVLNLFDRSGGSLLATASMPNPQRSIAADVMGRIQAAMEGKRDVMQQEITDAIRELLGIALKKAGISASVSSKETDTSRNPQITSAVVTGNTTMLCLLTGTDPSPMAKAPFPMPDRFGKEISLPGITADLTAYLPVCMHAFVGADITCALLASGLTEKDDTVLLADIGTNGELALWKGGKLYVTSTAAGPAFEGAGITMGCGSIEGAIDHVEIDGGRPIVHTIGGKKPCGLCGSGLIDAVAAGLELELISETGAMEKPFFLAEGVALYPEDVRSLQLAKAAVCAGIRTLLKASGTGFGEVRCLCIAGGFGSHINEKAAADIGLIPEELVNKVIPLGNAALAGASQLLLHPDEKANEKRIAERSEHVDLGGNPLFNDYYMECMLFGEE